MKVTLGGGAVLAIAGLAAVAGVGYLVYTKRQAIADALNPTKDTNLAYQGANAITRAITGDQAGTLGNNSFAGVDTVKKFFGVAGEPDLSAPVVLPSSSPASSRAAGAGVPGTLTLPPWSSSSPSSGTDLAAIFGSSL